MAKLLTELAGVALVVVGIGLWYWPMALVVAGCAVVAAIEVRA